MNFKKLLVATCLLASWQANSAIIYTDIADITLSDNTPIDIDFDGGGTDFSITNGGFGAIEPSIFFASADHHLTTVSQAEWDVLNGLPFNTVIDANAGFHDFGDAYVDPFWGTTMFPSNGDTYLGAQFNIGGNTHFGWIRVNWDGAGTFIAKDLAYNDTPSASILAGEMPSTASIFESNLTQVSLYPNPTTDVLHISCSSEINQIQLFNKIGEQVYTSELQESINVQNLPNGIYTIQLTGTSETISRQISIIR